MFEPKLFYQTFLMDYHKMKIMPLMKILSDVAKYEKEFFGVELEQEDREAYIRVLKSEMRQAYFHSIETFFELFFALDPTIKKGFDDENILFNITNSNIKETNKRIQEIADNQSFLNFLDTEITYNNHKITVGHYIFYFGIFSKDKCPADMFDAMLESLAEIKVGIQMIAKDFMNREEYNSYKHGLRILPAIKKMMLAQADTMDVKVSWDISDSMSFLYKSKTPDEVKMTTKVFDTERDYCMSYFCSNLIYNMIYFRRVVFCKESIKEEKFRVPMFSKHEIEECGSYHIDLKEFVWSLSKKKKEG